MRDKLILLAAVGVLISLIVFPITNSLIRVKEADTKAILTLVEKGVNPISARCAIAGDDDKLCAIHVATYKGEVK